MHFCNICENMYYLKIGEDNPNTLIYYCRHCGNEDSKLNKDNICVSKTQIKRNKETVDIASNIPFRSSVCCGGRFDVSDSNFDFR